MMAPTKTSGQMVQVKKKRSAATAQFIAGTLMPSAD